MPSQSTKIRYLDAEALVWGLDLITLVWTDGDRQVPCDSRRYDKANDGLAKDDHLRAMLRAAKDRGLVPECVTFDSWYSGLENLKVVRMHDAGPPDLLPIWGVSLATVAVVLLAVEGGFRPGQYRRRRSEQGDRPPVGEMVAATLALLAFLLAFTSGPAA